MKLINILIITIYINEVKQTKQKETGVKIDRQKYVQFVFSKYLI